MAIENKNQERSPERLPHMKVLFKTGNFVFMQLSKFSYHYSFYFRNKLYHGNVDFSKKHFKVVPLFLTITIISVFILFGINTTSAMMETEFPVMENDLKDQQAKNADDKYLEDTEKQKFAVITEEAADDNKTKKLSVIKYKIREGDTLSEIANKFGVPIDTIAGSSGISSDSIIHTGQELHIPNKKGIVYKFRTGDTLASIALKYKVKIEEVIEENHLANTDILFAGDKLFLPGAIVPDTNPVWKIPIASRIITSGYGWRSYPKRKFHDALDLKAHYESVKAARNGKIIYSGWMGGYGNTVIIQHPGNIKTLYAHNSRLFVKSGQYVSAGKVISRSGCSGFCFGPHLHFEVIKNGSTINPKKLFKGLSYRK